MAKGEKHDFGTFQFMLKCLEGDLKKKWAECPSVGIGDEGNSILHVAVELHSTPELFKLLLNIVSDCNLSNSKGETALHLVIEKDRMRLFEFLIKQPTIDVNKENKQGETPLHYCFKRQFINIPMIRGLIEKGANLNAKDQEGNTALHLAVKGKNFEGVQILLDVGAIPNVNNKHKKCPLSIAEKETKDPRIQALLKRANYKRRQSLNFTEEHFASLTHKIPSESHIEIRESEETE